MPVTVGHLDLMDRVYHLLEEDNNEAGFHFITWILPRPSSLCHRPAPRHAPRHTMKPMDSLLPFAKILQAFT